MSASVSAGYFPLFHSTWRLVPLYASFHGTICALVTEVLVLSCTCVLMIVCTVVNTVPAMCVCHVYCIHVPPQRSPTAIIYETRQLRSSLPDR